VGQVQVLKVFSTNQRGSDMFSANWMTTVAGAAMAILELVQNGGPANASAASWGLSIITAIFGAIAKDYNVTGGTKQQ
jgi:hypothetical protein